MKAMTNEEAIRRLVDIGRTIKVQTEGDERNYIALEMAINALQHTQGVVTFEKTLENAEECTTLNTEIGKKYAEDMWKQKDPGKEITMSDLTIMSEYVNKYQVDIELTITPEEQRIEVRPWKANKIKTDYIPVDA